jgi:hypothetical protein
MCACPSLHNDCIQSTRVSKYVSHKANLGKITWFHRDSALNSYPVLLARFPSSLSLPLPFSAAPCPRRVGAYACNAYTPLQSGIKKKKKKKKVEWSGVETERKKQSRGRDNKHHHGCISSCVSPRVYRSQSLPQSPPPPSRHRRHRLPIP